MECVSRDQRAAIDQRGGRYDEVRIPMWMPSGAGNDPKVGGANKHLVVDRQYE
jgi:hypothetical protein